MPLLRATFPISGLIYALSGGDLSIGPSSAAFLIRGANVVCSVFEANRRIRGAEAVVSNWNSKAKATLDRDAIYFVGRKNVIEGLDDTDPKIDGFVFVDFESLADCFAARPRPTAILSVLIGNGFDAVDIAGELHRSGYQGQYRALASAIPAPNLIKREVAQVAPGLDFEIIEVADLFG